jgi:phosphatidylserine decarboxylase
VTLYLAALGFTLAAVFFALVTAFLVFFFRDPERRIPEQQKIAVSPADGKIVEVGIVPEGDLDGQPSLKISVFMSLLDVHVNRAPADGMVTSVSYYPGKFFAANRDKSSKENERNVVRMEIAGGQSLTFVQVAGLIARRIVCRVRVGDRLRRGERFGLICFGSRLDVFLPSGTRPAVSVGDKVRAGVTILGYLT